MPVWARIATIIIAFTMLAGIFHVFGALIAGIDLMNLQFINLLTLDQLIVLQVSGLFACLIITYLYRKYIDCQSLFSLGFALQGYYKDLLIGFIIALSVLGTGTLILIGTGNVHISGIQFDFRFILKSFFLYLIVSLTEELLIRGYILNNLMSSINKYWALIISSLIFCSMHFLNSNLSFFGILNLFLAGIMLGSSYIFIKNLWFPISLHLFWNFIQGPVLGYNVSGHRLGSFIELGMEQKNIMNGGNFGFEGSVICSLLSVLSIIFLIGYYRKKTTDIYCYEKTSQ